MSRGQPRSRRHPIGRQVRCPGADRHGKSGAAAFLAGNGDVAAVETSQFLDERQPDARPFMRARPTVLDAVEALEHAGQVCLGNANAGVGHLQLDAIAAPAQFHRNPALERELEGVRQQVEENLLPHIPIDEHRFRQGIAVDDQREPRLFNGRTEYARELRGQLREVGGFVMRVDAPRFDARKIQQRIHESQQPQRIAMRDLLPFSMHGWQRRTHIGQAVFERSDEQGERGAEFVTDVAEECRFRAIERRQCFGARALVFVGPRIRDGGGQLIGDQVQKRAVGIVERPPRIEADHQSPGPRLRGRRREWEFLDQFQG